MRRRQFCRSAITASLAAAYPFLTACRSEAPPAPPPVADRKVDTSIPGLSLDGAEIEIEKAAVEELSEALSGQVLLSGHPEYDVARKIWNGMHDRHPALIARCQSTQDVQHAVDFARDHGILTAVRGGGHSWPGKSVADGGLMIDLAQMNNVRIDPEARRAFAPGGALLGHLDNASLEHGLVTTAGVVSHTGVGGFTLGGGFGRLNRKYGLTIDNLVSAEIVTADGQVRRVSADAEPDLFWAIRGGGGNFGVVTQFEYQLHPFDRNVFSGSIVWPMEQAREVLEFYAEWSEGLSDELYTGPAMMTLPDGPSVLAMEVVYAGDPSEGEKEIAPLRAIGKPIEDGVTMQDYTVMQTQEDATFGHGIRSYAKNGMLPSFSQGLVDAMIDSFVPDPRLAFFTHTAGGAVKRVGELDTAFPHRNAETMIIVAGGWMDPADDQDAMATARNWFAQLSSFTGGYYDNIEFEGDTSARGNYGPAYDRLSRVKGQYDPGNLFRLNSNIEPAA